MNNLTVFNSELIPVYATDKGEQVVLGRELHERLKIGKDYSTWFKDTCGKYAFEENADYYGLSGIFPNFGENNVHNLNTQNDQIVGSSENRGRNRIDHVLTLDMAKEIAMVQKSPEGKAIRKKLIELEKLASKGELASWRIKDELERAKAWIKEEERRRELEEKNKVLQIDNAALEQENKDLDLENLYLEGRVDYLQPKADGYDEFIELGECLGVRDTANLLGVGQNEFIDWLRDRSYIHKKTLRAKAQYLDKAGNANQWFDEKVVPCNDGSLRRQLFITSKGQDAFRKMLKGVDLSQYKRKRK